MRPVALPAPASLDLSSHNTLGLPCAAAACVVVTEPAQLEALPAAARRHGGLCLLAGGSNVVLPERLETLVARMALRGVRSYLEPDGSRVIEAAAGESWHGLVANCVAQGWGGLENLALIPGAVGAAPVQNIGAYGLELAQRVDRIQAYDLQAMRWTTLDAAQCGFGYRDSLFKREPGRWAISHVRLRLPATWSPILDYPDLRRHPALADGDADPRAVFEAVCAIRRAKLPDPAVLGNAGSFFKNPVVDADRHAALMREHPAMPAYAQAGGAWKLAAGWLIERSGWKGKRLGPVGMDARQALVLVNHGGATADDVWTLAGAIQDDVAQRFGVRLEPEPVRVM